MTPTVFLSHASEDKDRFVLDFATRLRNKGINVWLDKWEILPGDSLVNKIFDEGIKNAQAIIVILSQHSIGKPWVREELNAAVVRKINGISKLIPVIIDDCEVPEALRSTVWQRIGNLNEYDSDLDSIVRSVFEHREKPPIGKRPGYADSHVATMPNLTKIDSLILKFACETAIQKEIGFIGDVDGLFEITKSYDVPEGEFYESLEILDSRNYIEGQRVFDKSLRIKFFTITQFGLEEYARAYVENYSQLPTLVGLQIINNNLKTAREIAAHLKQPFIIIEHILELMKMNEMISTVSTSGKEREVHIVIVHAELKRRLKDA